jgi:hypothetical protein
MHTDTPPRKGLVPLAAALRHALLLAAALLTIPAFAATQAPSTKEPASKVHAATGKKPGKHATATAKTAKAKPDALGAKSVAKRPTAAATRKAAAKDAGEPKPGQLADFGNANAGPEVKHLANWVAYTRNNQKKAFVVIDKKQARMYVFDPRGKLRSDSPVLLGKAVGDNSVPGIGNKPLSQIADSEKTTPAGRFLALPGKNIGGDDIIWIDYNAAVSMHRLRKVGNEHRAERMATPEVSDNRISNGCVNVPPAFYNSVLRPTVLKYGAFVYVLPETRTPQQLFGSYDVPNSGKGVQLAQGR